MIILTREELSKHPETFAEQRGEYMELGIGIEKLKTGDNPYFESPSNRKTDKGISCLLFNNKLFIPENEYEARNANSFLYEHCTENNIYDKGYLNTWYRIPKDTLNKYIK